MNKYVLVVWFIAGVTSCVARKTNRGATGSGLTPVTGIATDTVTGTSTDTTVSGPWVPSFALNASLQPLDHLYMTPTYAVLDATGLHGSLRLSTYQPVLSAASSSPLLLNLSGLLGSAVLSSENFQRRTRLFLADYLSGRDISLSLRGSEVARVTSGADGDILFNYNDTAGATATDQLKSEGSYTLIPTVEKTQGVYDVLTGGGIEVIKPKGLSVISDIDDTIKVTNVKDTQAMLKATFVDDFSIVPGMPAYYQYLKKDCGAAIHYVSGSPEQLGPELWRFFEKFSYPFGSLHLRRIRLKDYQSYLLMVANPTSYKKTLITQILQDFPQRQFIFIGDTGEQDPEIYASYLATHAAQIRKVILRVPGTIASEQTRINSLYTDASKVLLVNNGDTIPKTCGN